MKFIKRIIVLSLSLAITLLAVACNKADAKATEYGLVHGHYVAEVMVTMNGDDIKKVTFDEVETPYSWARIDRLKTTINAADKTTNSAFTGTGTNREYASKIKIGDVIFTARANGEDNTYVDYFNSGKNGTTTFEKWLENSANAKWYFERITAGDYDVLKADDTAYNVEFTDVDGSTLSKSERWLKSKNGYWASSLGGKGWNANMQAMSDYIVKNGLEDYIAVGSGEIEFDATNGYVINDVNTGATLTDFTDYMNIAVAAYNSLKNADAE